MFAVGQVRRHIGYELLCWIAIFWLVANLMENSAQILGHFFPLGSHAAVDALLGANTFLAQWRWSLGIASSFAFCYITFGRLRQIWRYWQWWFVFSLVLLCTVWSSPSVTWALMALPAIAPAPIRVNSRQRPKNTGGKSFKSGSTYLLLAMAAIAAISVIELLGFIIPLHEVPFRVILHASTNAWLFLSPHLALLLTILAGDWVLRTIVAHGNPAKHSLHRWQSPLSLLVHLGRMAVLFPILRYYFSYMLQPLAAFSDMDPIALSLAAICSLLIASFLPVTPTLEKSRQGAVSTFGTTRLHASGEGWRLGAKVYWPLLLIWSFAAREGARWTKHLDQDLVGSLVSDVFRDLMPLGLVVAAIPLAFWLSDWLRRGIWKHTIAWGIVCTFIGTVTWSFCFHRGTAWAASSESYWQFGRHVAQRGHTLLAGFGWHEKREVDPYLQLFQQMVLEERQSMKTAAKIAVTQPEPTTVNQSGATKTSPTDFLASKPPHIFLFVADAISRQRISAYGYGVPTTPNLARVAKESFLFENSYSAATDTFQNIHAIFSGAYTGRSRHLQEDEKTKLCSQLREAGYLIILPEHAASLGLAVGSCHPDLQLSYTGATPSDWQQIHAFINRHPEQPVFVYMHHMGAHPPWNLSPQELRFGDSSSNKYDAMIFRADQVFGQWVDSLREWGLWHDAIVAFSSDHGLGLGEHHHLNGASFTTLFQENLAVPLVIKSSRQDHGEVIHSLYSHVDFRSLIRDLALTKKSLTAQDVENFLQGAASTNGANISVLAHSKQESTASETVPSTSPGSSCKFAIAAYRDAFASVCEPGQKLVWHKGLETMEYFQLATDPWEEHDALPALSLDEFRVAALPLARFIAHGEGTYAESGSQDGG